jgi:DNA-binding protein HU-beta
MNKAELVDFIANKTGLTKKDVNHVLDAMIEAVVETVSSDDSVTLTGFGTFLSVHRKATTKRNPKTGEKVNVPAKNVPKFRPGKSFKESVA